MSLGYIGEIRMFAGAFAPAGWAFCNGQLLAISQNDALFSLIGTTYGGDGETTFALPDLRGRLPVHKGAGPGLSPRALAERGGMERVTLNLPQLPVHGHAVAASGNLATDHFPKGHLFAQTGKVDAYVTGGPFVQLNAQAVGTSGGSQSHDNLHPFLCVNFIIALNGIYPSPN